MPRTPQVGELALLAGDHNEHAVFSVMDHLGTWHDLSSYVVGISLGESIDTPGLTGTITLLRDVLGVSIAPTIAASPLNNIGGTFVPLVDGARFVKLETNISALGAAAGTLREVLYGRIANPEWGGDENTIVIAIGDMAARMMEMWIQDARDYGSDAGVPIETAMQQILNDNPDASGWVPVLYVPASPAVNLHAFTQAKGPLLDALTTLAAQIGWSVRWIYDSADVLRLTFFEPDRAKTAPDLTFDASKYYALSSFTKNTDDVRTYGVVRFLDRASGAVLTAIATASAGAVAEYGYRYIEIAEDKASNIDSLPEAQAMIDAVIADLSDAFATQAIEIDYNPLVQLGDLCQFTANGVHYDADQLLAVVNIAHTFALAGSTTQLLCRGRVAGAYKNWLLSHGQGAQSNGPTGAEIYLSNFRIIARDALSVTYAWDDTPNASEVWVFDKTVALPVMTEPWPDLTHAIAPDARLAPGAGSLVLTFPAEGNQRFVQLDPRSVDHVAGDQHRIVLSPAGALPTFGKITQSIGASGLFAAIRIDVDDPQGLGGTLEAWLNRFSPDSADPSVGADATLTIGATPHTFTPAEVWSNGITMLSNIQVHPGRGKSVFFRYTNTNGVSSGIQSFQLLSEGGIIDGSGNLLPGVINDALQFATTLQPVQIFASSLPGTAADGQFAFLISTGKLYRRTGGVWSTSVDGADIITSSIVAGKIAAGAITSSAIAALAVQAYHLSIAVLASISSDLGIIVAGKLTSVSGAVTLDLNATGTGHVFDSANFYITAAGVAHFAGIVDSGNFTAAFASFAGAVDVTYAVRAGNGFYAPNTFGFEWPTITMGIWATAGVGMAYSANGQPHTFSDPLIAPQISIGADVLTKGPAGSGPGGAGHMWYTP